MSKTTTECTESRERTDAINKLVNSVLGASSVVRGEMVNHTMTKGMAATERTVEDALAHADREYESTAEYRSLHDVIADRVTSKLDQTQWQSGYRQALSDVLWEDLPTCPQSDLVLLAEEVRRLRDPILASLESEVVRAAINLYAVGGVTDYEWDHNSSISYHALEQAVDALNLARNQLSKT